MAREILGNDANPVLAMLLGDIAGMLRDKGDIRLAELHIRDALFIGRQVFRIHPLMVRPLMELGELSAVRGDFEEAEHFLRDAHFAAQNLFGSQHETTVMSQFQLGRLLCTKGDYRNGEADLRRSLDSLRVLRGDRHPEVLSGMFDLARCLYYQGKFREADHIFQQGVEGRRTQCFPSLLAACLREYAGFLRDYARYEEAARFNAECRAVLQKCAGDANIASPELAGQLLLDDGNLAASEVLLRRAVAATQHAFPAEHPSIALATSQLADVLREEGKLAEAEVLYHEALAIRKKKLDESPQREHPLTLSTRMKLACLWCRRGRAKKPSRRGRGSWSWPAHGGATITLG